MEARLNLSEECSDVIQNGGKFGFCSEKLMIRLLNLGSPSKVKQVNNEQSRLGSIYSAAFPHLKANRTVEITVLSYF